MVDGIILPNLGMKGETESCSFLNEDGRCSIHPYRPGICRLFPLGRCYEDGCFTYFLQVHECRKENRTKVKVRKWIDTPDAVRYDQYITEWHYFLKGLQEKLREREESASQEAGEQTRSWEQDVREISMYVLQNFYLTAYLPDGGFYEEFYRRLQAAQQWAAGNK